MRRRRQGILAYVGLTSRASACADGVIKASDGGHTFDRIVIGSHGRRGFRRLVLGSVAEAVVRTADRPVLTVHGQKAATIAEGAA